MISSNVVIITNDELEKIKKHWFEKGVERGKFEERVSSDNKNLYSKGCITAGVTVKIHPSHPFKEVHNLIGVTGYYSNNLGKWQVFINDPSPNLKICWADEKNLEILS